MEGLDQIPWHDLRHNEGTASDVPALLRALTRAHEASEALEDLSSLLFHTGDRICTASAAATPFLVDLATDPDVTVRARIVMSLAENACEAELCGGRHLLDPAWSPAWAAAVLELVRLLDDEDVEVRRATAYALAYAGPRADAVLPALLTRFPAETDPATRRNLVLTVARLTEYEPSGWLAALRDDPDPRIRLAATFSGGWTVSDPGTVIDAIALEDVSSWECSPWVQAAPDSTICWVDRELADDVMARVRFAFTMLAHPDPEYRTGGIKAAARVVSGRRSALTEIGPLLAGYMDDPSEVVRAFAVHLVVAGGSAPAHLDRLAGLLGHPAPPPPGRMDRHIGDLALWGLSWAGDRRAQAGLLDRLTGSWPRWPTDGVRYDESSYGIDPPGLDELLIPLDGWSQELLPAIRAILSKTWSSEVQIPLTRTLARWGPAATPAVPELIRVLRIGSRRWAATALGVIGPDAAPAVESLLDLLRHDGSGPGGRPLWNDERVEIAWALWRVTGDTGPVLDVFGQVPWATLDHRAIRRIADLGPPAARHQDALHETSVSTDDRKRVEAVHALWRITGDERDAVRVLTRVVEPLAEGRALPVMRTATRYLAEIGPPAAAAIPVLRAALALDRRLTDHGGWRAFDEDRRQRDLARDALRRICP
ncbi:HEAT repeat domain-containing protein [Streptosporangium sp. NPDC050855]|uniref:HEAT repeat domain-containing protein n=1 Tax=Streptosporangium sp. NPDC050855 TaxID=3366194 RepID=UPI003799042B